MLHQTVHQQLSVLAGSDLQHSVAAAFLALHSDLFTKRLHPLFSLLSEKVQTQRKKKDLKKKV